MAESFARAWLPILRSEGIKPEWEDRYIQLVFKRESQSTGTLDTEETSEDKRYEENVQKEKCDAFELDD
jgi:hypothetical protein